jgi:uncharacterized protein YndB with AHSA1/START domain
MQMDRLRRHVMREATQSVAVSAPADRVFAFVSDPLRLPEWATGFARAVTAAGGERWQVETPDGAVDLRVDARPDVGVVDFWISPAPGVEILAASRVIAFGGASSFTFTQFQPEGMADDAFEAQVATAREELATLRRLLEK